MCLNYKTITNLYPIIHRYCDSDVVQLLAMLWHCPAVITAV